jgi:hypothetical protein
MLAPTRELVAEVNRRARDHRLDGAPAGQEVRLGDGNRASVGDMIITRTNDRRLSATDWVKNGDRWTITGIGRRGRPHGPAQPHPADRPASSRLCAHLHRSRLCHHRPFRPRRLRRHHARPVDRAGRGRTANHLYLQVVGDGDPHSIIRPETVAPRTTTETLQQILARDDTPTSATTLMRRLSDPAARLFDAVMRYTDGLHVAAEQLVGPEIVGMLDARADQIVPELTSEPS